MAFRVDQLHMHFPNMITGVVNDTPRRLSGGIYRQGRELISMIPFQVLSSAI